MPVVGEDVSGTPTSEKEVPTLISSKHLSQNQNSEGELAETVDWRFAAATKNFRRTSGRKKLPVKPLILLTVSTTGRKV